VQDLLAAHPLSQVPEDLGPDAKPKARGEEKEAH